MFNDASTIDLPDFDDDIQDPVIENTEEPSYSEEPVPTEDDFDLTKELLTR